LAAHFKDDSFSKSQTYGRDKAKFAIFSSFYNQAIEIAVLWYNGQAWAWDVAGSALGKLGYTGNHEVNPF